jgi:hypothetical protein
MRDNMFKLEKNNPLAGGISTAGALHFARGISVSWRNNLGESNHASMLDVLDFEHSEG